jgi:hypothetical protein
MYREEDQRMGQEVTVAVSTGHSSTELKLKLSPRY